MGINTNSFENYKNTIEASEKGGFLSKLKSFGLDSLGGLDSFMGKDIINANKLLKSFKGFNLSNILSNLGGFFKNLGLSALDILKDMGMDAIRQLQNATINFASNLVEDLYNNIRSMMYIPDSVFALTLKGLYLAGADLAYNKHYIRSSALQRDWATSLKFIDEQYGIDYNIRDYKDLEKDLALCAEHSCVNNLYYMFRKIYDQLTTVKSDIVVTESLLKPYTKPIKEFILISYDDIPNYDNIYVQIGEEKTKLNKDKDGMNFIKNHKDMNYYTETIFDYEGITNGLYESYNYETVETKDDIESKYNAYLENVTLVKHVEQLMLVYFKSLIVHGYTYLNASSVQKFFSDFDTVLLPKYYGSTDDKYNGIYSFTQDDCLIMMPDYKGNDITKSDMYTQQLATKRNNEYIATSGARSEASKAAMEALKAKNAAKNASGTGKGPWSEAGYTINSAVEAGTAGATAKIKAFRAKAMESVANRQNVSYMANIKNGISGTLENNSKGLWNRTGKGINAKEDNKRVSSMYDRDVVKKYELVGNLSSMANEIDFLNKDTKYIVLRNKNIKQIYALLANPTIYGNDRMVNDYFYKRCQIKTMNTLNQSLSKVGSILGSSYAVQALFDLENAVDSSAYIYLKKVEKFLLNPKEHSYYGIDTMFNSGDNIWTQFGDYFKQAYNWDDSISDDPELESIIEKLSETSNTTSGSSSKPSVSEIDPIKDLTPENGANGETYAEILNLLESENTAKLFVDNVVRFMSEIPMLDLRDILVKYLTMFYKSMKARDYEPDTYFKTLIKSMSGIDGISHYDDLNSKVFNKSTHKTLLANGKFLISIYALKNSYKYFLENEKDTNKEELTKIYNLVFAMGSADLQMNGTIAGLYKFDKEQLNSLVKRNFFTSINHLKSINDKNKPLIKTAPRYKDNLTKEFNYKFDLRGVSGYSLDNDRILYVPENSTGDWNSIGVSNDKEIGSFFCKSNINGDGNGIYRRTYEGTTLNKLDVISNSGTKITDREFFVITFDDHGAVYFGLNDMDTNKNSISESLFVYDQTNNRIIGVSGFTDNPKDYSFKIDASHELLIITSKNNKGCYYTKLNTTICSRLSTTGSNHYFVKLGDNSLLVCPKNSKSGIGYFDIDGNYVNTCDLPDNVSTITRVKSVVTETIVNVKPPIIPPESSSESSSGGEAIQPIIIPTPVNIYGALISTNIGIIHLLAMAEVDITTGNLISSKRLSIGKTYSFTSVNSPCYIYDNMKVIGVKEDSKFICKFIKSKAPMTITSTSVLLSKELFSFGNEVEITNPSYPLETYNINYVYDTNDGIYTILTRTDSNTRELYFIPYKNDTEIMYLIRSEIANTITSVDIINPINISSSKKPVIIIYPNKSLDFISIRTTSSSINISIVDSYFKDIDDEIPSDDTLVVKVSKYDWENISVPNDNNIYIQNKNYGVILFKNGESIHKLMNYSNLTTGDITKADLVFDYQIVKAKSITLFANKSSGNKYVKNGYGLFKSTNDGINYQYADISAYHDGDIGSMAYDKHHNCIYFGSYRDKTIFDYDFLATIAAFDIDAYISQLSYYELSKLAKNLIKSSTTTINEGILDLLASKKEDMSFTYTIDELLNGIIEASLKIQESCQKSLMDSTLFTDLTNYKTATELFDDVTSDDFNDDMTKDFITSYPGDISIESELFPTDTEDFSIGDISDIDNDGDVDQDDLNWYQALLNGGEIDNKLSLNDWFNNLANGVYGNGMGSILSLRLSFDKRIKYFATLRANKSHFLTSGKALSSDEINPDVEGPNSIIDPTTDPKSPEYKWYYNIDFATEDFENSDENGESDWS